MKMIKRLIMAALVLVILGAGALFGIYKWTGTAGQTSLELWIGQSLVGVLEGHLNPKVAFGSLDYQAPYTVVVDDLAIMRRDNDEQMMDIERAVLTLAQIPKQGEPIQIKEVLLQKPELRFVHSTDGTGLLGWSDFVKQDAIQNPSSVEEGKRLSDVLVMRKVEVREANLMYDSGDGTPPMRLENLAFDMDTRPVDESGEAGWYTIDSVLAREGLGDIKITGQVNLDTFTLDLDDTTLNTHLDEENYEILPPQLQELLRTYEIQGDLNANVSGRIPLATWREQARLSIRGSLTDARVVIGDKQVPAEVVNLTGELASGTLNGAFDAELLDGTAGGTFQCALVNDQSLRADWNASGIEIQETLRTLKPGQAPPIAGKVMMTGSINSTLTAVRENLDGAGHVEVTQARIITLPIVNDLATLISGKSLSGDDPSTLANLTDALTMDLRFKPQHVGIRNLKITSGGVNGRGEGRVYYDGRLDMTINAGPLEKVQDNLGGIGDILGVVTDQLVKYHVGGTLREPTVSLKPLGLGG